MPRFALTVEYDGAPFAGFQRQDGLATVQGALEAAILALTGEQVSLRTAGRTDAGVHARGLVVHVDLSRDWPTDTLRDGFNAHLRPQAVGVLAARAVQQNFDARFSAVRRHYRYTILNRRCPPILERSAVWGVPRPLDAQAMHEAAQRLIGHHDFTTFRSSSCQANSPLRTLDVLQVTRQGEHLLIDTAARSFLHNQVRSMVGALKRVGEGHLNSDDLTAMLAARNRAACPAVAPPQGLVFMKVEYREQ